MSDSIEDLLAKVKAKYNDSEPPRVSPQPTSPPPVAPASGDAIDTLLADLQAPPPTSRSTAANRPPIDAIAEQGPVTGSQPQPCPSVVTPNADPLLAQLKAQYAAQDQAEALERQQQQQAEQQRQAQVQQALVQQAEAWLRTLDTRSGEGAWFEAFAANYESRLAAAIDYLGVSQDT